MLKAFYLHYLIPLMQRSARWDWIEEARMNEEWWEGLVRFITDYWWIVVLILLIGLLAYFTRGFGLL